MPEALRFLRSGPALLVTGILLVQIGLFYAVPKSEYIPHPPPLGQFQRDVGEWRMAQELELDSETQSFLKADDTISRSYLSNAGPLTLFVAFFKSQRGGVTPHSPKVCLPGNGWVPVGARTISISLPGEPQPVPVNRYIVRHGENESLVLYWYATSHRVVADEYLAKLYLMYEGLRYRRSDEAIYRVIVPILKGEESAEANGVRFVQAFYPPLKRQMWSE
jgi:EpsI family protein